MYTNNPSGSSDPTVYTCPVVLKVIVTAISGATVPQDIVLARKPTEAISGLVTRV
jgi:hypothetical protein